MSEHEIFAQALEIEDIPSRNEFLGRVCQDAPDLRARIERLLAAVEARSSFMEHESTRGDAVTPDVGNQIGVYTLKEKIGEGGMGMVYVAEQKTPIRRRVALKVIKPGMNSDQVIARFESERETLALLDHPNIARVLDGGKTAQGLPYIVMELVNGNPITAYCDDNRLTIRQRLELFREVCKGIQHAHQKGIIHRDLKPSNVLVARYDGDPVPKVIDFGVSKALGKGVGELSVYTHFGQILGTFEYMSPEQAQRNQLDVDTRSDVYALGVILYEILTGELPFERERLRNCALDEMFRIIREEEAVKPSTRLSTAGSSEMVAEMRQTEPLKLASNFRGELDWIALKALSKERNLRYESATAFARDIQNYLDGNPVEACPPSTTYRFRKVFRKHRAAILAATLFTVVLTVGTTVSVWQTIRATWANDKAQNLLVELRAETRRKDQLNNELVTTLRMVEREKEQAELERARAGRSFDFVGDILASMLRRGSESTVGDMVVELSNRIDEEFVDFPKTKADILELLAQLYHKTGDQRLRDCGLRYLNAVKAAYPRDSQEYVLGLSEYETLSLYNDASDQERLELAKTLADKAGRLFGEGHPVTLRCLKNVYERFEEMGLHDDAVQVLEQIDRNTRISEHPPSIVAFDVKDRLEVKRLLASQYFKVDRKEDAEKQNREIIEIAFPLDSKEFPWRDDRIQNAITQLAYSAYLNEPEAGVRFLRKSIQEMNEQNVQTQNISIYLAEMLEDIGDWEEAVKTIDGVLNDSKIQEFLNNPVRHHELRDLEFNPNPNWVLGQVIGKRLQISKDIWDRRGGDDEFIEFVEFYESAINDFEPIFGEMAMGIAVSRANCGLAYYKCGQYSNAVELLKAMIPFSNRRDYRKPTKDSIHPSYATRIADCLAELGEYQQAVGFLDEARPFERRLQDGSAEEKRRSLMYLDHVAAFVQFKMGQADKSTFDQLAELVIHDFQKLTAVEIEEDFLEDFHFLHVQLIRNTKRLIEFLETNSEDAEKLARWRQRLTDIRSLDNPNLETSELHSFEQSPE